MTNDITYRESENLTVVSDFGTPQTVACQAPLSMEFSSQKYWSGSCFLLQEIVPTQKSNPSLLQLHVDSSSSEPRKNKKWPRITPEKVTGTEREGKFQRGKNRKFIWWVNFGHIKWYLDILFFENSKKNHLSGGDLSTCDAKWRKEDWA